jgi:hypothetical protein
LRRLRIAKLSNTELSFQLTLAASVSDLLVIPESVWDVLTELEVAVLEVSVTGKLTDDCSIVINPI